MAALIEPSLVRLRELTEALDSCDSDLGNLFWASPDLMAIVRIDGSFCRLNMSWQKILGWTEQELMERPWQALIHPDDVANVRDVLSRLMKMDVPRFVCRIQGRDCRPRTVEFSATKWRDGLSNLVGRLVPDVCLSCPITGHRGGANGFGSIDTKQ